MPNEGKDDDYELSHQSIAICLIDFHTVKIGEREI